MSHTIIDRRHSARASMEGVRAQQADCPAPQPAPFPNGMSSFDGAGQSPMRSRARANINSFWELNLPGLREMQMKSRDLRNDLAVYRNIIKTWIEFSIGWGLIAMPKSGNKPFDARAKPYFLRWARDRRVCDARQKQNHCQQQTTACGDMMVDGEVFSLRLTDALGRPTRRQYRTEQCGGLYGGSAMIGNGWFGGIQFNPEGAPLLYEFRRPIFMNGLPVLDPQGEIYDARFVRHIFDLERSNQYRGLPWAYSSLNGGIDALDISSLAIAKDKINAALFESIETPTGSMPGGFANGGGLAGPMSAQAMGPPATYFTNFASFPATGQLGATYVASDTERRFQWNGTTYVEVQRKDFVRYLNIHGTLIPVFRTGEKLVPHDGGNTMNAREMLEFIFNALAVAFGAPVELFWNMARLGGASVRGTLELGKRSFERTQRIMIDQMCQDDYENVIGTGILAWLYPADYPGVEPLEPPPGMNGWNVCTWRGPQDLTVDKGREGRMYLELIRAGLMSREEWWTRNNEDPDEMEAAPINELAARRQQWIASGLPEDKFWLREFGASGTLNVREMEDGPGVKPGPLGNFTVEELAENLADLIKDRTGPRL